jgi:arylsulfatase A-like enzyme/Tfp pilus assembly protein PilF
LEFGIRANGSNVAPSSRGSRIANAAAKFLIAIGLAALFATPHAQPKPDILLITLDTIRADRMGFLGSTRGLTPELDALARESIVFTRAYAQAPITTVSHATLLTGTFPPSHGVTDFGAPLPATAPYLPDLLQHAGYRTAAFVGSLILDPRNGTAPGFDRGFQTFDAGFRLRQPGDDRYHSVERRGDEVAARAIEWLKQPRRVPSFVWVHLFDAHDPYDPPPDLKHRFSHPYDGEIASVDRIVGRLLRVTSPSTLIVVAADHGEALGDHGEETHGVFLYDDTIHVPLLLRLPGRRAAATSVTAAVRLADVAPTVLEAIGSPVPSSIQGASLLPLVGADTGVGARRSGPPPAERPVYAETDYPRRAFGWSPLTSWRADQFLFVRAPRRELYDSRVDAAAARNIADTRSRVADAMNAELGAFVQRTRGTNQPSANADPALAERLAALGYVGGSSAAAPASGIDPKDRIQTANALHTAVQAIEDGAFARAIPLLEKVVAAEPRIPIAQLNLGLARTRQRQWAQAIAPLKRAIELQPESMIAHYEIGVALYETGDLQTAASHFAIVAERMPKWADARYALGSVYARIDRVADATRELRAALGLEPRHFRANLLLGRILSLQGQATAAIPYLETATAVQPTSAEAHEFLADALAKAGRHADAEAERRKIKK